MADDTRALRRRVEVLATDKDGKVYGGRYPDKTFGAFGGGIEAGETIEEAAAREFLEESGRRVCNLRRLDIEPVVNLWKGVSPYASDEDLARFKRYKGDKTYYVTGDIVPGKARKNKDESALTRVKFQQLETALRKLVENDGDDKYRKLKKGREKALKLLSKEQEEAAMDKTAFALGFQQRWAELEKGAGLTNPQTGALIGAVLGGGAGAYFNPLEDPWMSGLAGAGVGGAAGYGAGGVYDIYGRAKGITQRNAIGDEPTLSYQERPNESYEEADRRFAAHLQARREQWADQLRRREAIERKIPGVPDLFPPLLSRGLGGLFGLDPEGQISLDALDAYKAYERLHPRER